MSEASKRPQPGQAQSGAVEKTKWGNRVSRSCWGAANRAGTSPLNWRRYRENSPAPKASGCLTSVTKNLAKQGRKRLLARIILPKGVDLKRIAPEDRESAYVTFYDTLNGLRQLQKVDVYATGSNSKTLSSDIDTNFVDRISQIVPGKLYIQSALSIPTSEKESQELLPLRRSGDFFRKMVVTSGYSAPRTSEEGIIYVGVIPFLLDATILDNALRN